MKEGLLEYYVQQIKDYCHLCQDCMKEEQWERAVRAALENFGELTCGNWLDEHVISKAMKYTPECCSCCPLISKINLPEEWVQPDTIETTIRVWRGLEVEEYPASSVFDLLTHDLRIDISEVSDCCDNCKEWELVVKYTVGTDEIPEDLLPWFCAIAKVHMNLEEIECANCGSEDDIAIDEVDDVENLSAIIKRTAMKYYQGIIDKYSSCLLKQVFDGSVVI